MHRLWGISSRICRYDLLLQSMLLGSNPTDIRTLLHVHISHIRVTCPTGRPMKRWQDNGQRILSSTTPLVTRSQQICREQNSVEKPDLEPRNWSCRSVPIRHRRHSIKSSTWCWSSKQTCMGQINGQQPRTSEKAYHKLSAFGSKTVCKKVTSVITGLVSGRPS